MKGIQTFYNIQYIIVCYFVQVSLNDISYGHVVVAIVYCN